MGLFSSKPAKSTTTVPAEYKPYVTQALTTASDIAKSPTAVYGGPRVAAESADIAKSREMLEANAAAGTPVADEAIGMQRNAAQGIQDLLGQDNPYQFSQYQFSAPGTFDAAAAQQYMNPYIQNVLDVQKTQAQRDFDIANQKRKSSSIFNGAFGGSGQLVSQGLAENDWLNRMNEIEATGMSNAYTDAEKMFGSDRDARMATERAQAGEQARVQPAQAAENAAYINRGITGLRDISGTAGDMAALETAARNGNTQAAQLLEASGKLQQGEVQNQYDTDYAEWLRQQQEPERKLGVLTSTLGGVNPGSTTTTTAASGSPIAQLMGLGSSVYSLYNAFKGNP